MAKESAKKKASPGLNLDAKAIEAINKSYATTNAEAKKQLVTQSALKDLAEEIKDSWGDLSQVLLKVNDYSKKLGDNFGDVEDIAKKLISNIESVGTELYEQLEVGDKIKKLQIAQGKRLSEFKKANQGLIELAQAQEKLDKEKNTMSLALYNNLQKELDQDKEINEALLARLHTEQKIAALQITALHALKDAADAMDMANEHAKKLGFNIENATNTVTNKLSKSFEFMEEIPFLSDVIGLDSIKEKLEKNVKDSLVRSMTEGKGAASSLFSAMTTGARTLMTTLGPFLPLIIAAAALYKAFEFDKELTQFSKDLDVSKDTAMGLSIEADAIAGHLGVAGVNGVEVGKAMTTIKNAMGTTAALANKELVGAVSLLQTRIGLSGEEAMALNSTATLLGTNLNDLAASSYDMADGLIGGKEMLQEMANWPKSLVAGYKGTTQQLQKAIVKGKLFGLTIEQAQKAGEGMLDIETSLQKEMTFNILAGKNMNLNKARQLALEGKTAELQDEILSQAGSLDDYQKMGPLQQKAMAEALNMSKDELTEMLTKTQEMADVGLSQAAVEEQMKLSLEDQQSTIDGMNDEKKKAYLQDLLNKKKQEEATAKFADSMTKLTEAFQKTMMPIVELLGEALGYVGDIIHWFTVGIEKLNHWIHSLTGAKEELKEGEGVMSSILKWAVKIGGAILLWNVGKKALGGLKSMIPGMGGGKTAEAASSATGSADQVKGATQGKNKVSQLLDGIKSIIESIKGVVQSAIQFVRDVGKDLITTVKDLFNGVVDLVRSVGTNVLSTLQELIGGIGKILADGTDIIVNVGSKLAEGAMKILNIIIEGLGKAAGQLPAIMSALGSAVVAFFTPMAALVPLAPAIAIFTLAMIGLGYAFKLLGEGIGAAAPGIEAFFNGMGTVIESVGTAISKVIETITTSIIRLQDIDPLRLMGVAGGIVSVGAAIAGFGAGAGAGGIMAGIGKFFDEDPVEKFNRFATIDSAKLVEVAGAIDKLGNAIANFSAQVGKIGEVSGIIETIDKVMELHDAVTENPIEEAISGVAEAVGGIFSKAASFVTSSAPEASSVTTSTGAAPAAAGGAAASQGSLKEVADLLKQILSATSQPVSINIGGKVIDEIGKQTTLRKTYSTKIDTAHGAFG